MFKLVIQDDEGKTTVVPLIRDELTIGRKEGNTIRLTERNVSRRHARVARSNGSITIEDLDSYNGIRVNGSRIDGKTDLQESDRVQIGDYLIEIRADSAKADGARSGGPTQPMEANGAAPAAESVSTHSEATTVPTPIVSPEPNEVAAAPTERIPALADQDVHPSAQPQGHGRMVVLSTNLAGREFELDKAAMVIGRTDENDIWINHRSISRHHAKIVREAGRYAIVDLQSSNGVRVNGEEYGKVELRRGDVVDLGHVRLRYVEPGEDFVFGRDAQAVDIAGEGKGRGGMWMLLLLLLVGGSVGGFVLFGQTQETAEGSAATDPAAATPAPTPAVEPTPVVESAETGDAAPETATDPEAELRVALDQALAARQADDWAAMQAAAEKALEIDPGSADASELLAQAQMEAASEAAFEEFQSAVAERQWKRVAELYAGLPATSVYKVKAQPDHDRLKAEYVAYQGQVAGKAAAKGDCREQRRMARQVIPQWPEAREAILSHSCRVAVARAPKESGGSSSSGDASASSGGDGSTTSGGASSPPAGPDYDELMVEAKAAARDNHMAKAHRLCRQALDRKPGDQDATMVCGIAACNLNKAAQAKKYIAKTKSSTRKGMIRQICLRNGVSDI